MKPVLGINPGPFAETLRRAHCAHSQAADADHVCIGRCTITREGVELDCKACGSQNEPLSPTDSESRGARAVVEAIGMSWSSLTPEAKRAAMKALTISK